MSASQSVTIDQLEITKVFSQKDSTPYSALLLTVMRLLFVTLLHDMPGKWNLTHGKRNEQADVEGMKML